MPPIDPDSTELKLRSTPTGGVAGEHSPYYRRLLSAGYKGYMQGTIGGAGYYGLLGLAVGTLVAVPAFLLFPPLGASIFMLIPAATGAGIVKGVNTFGNIGSTAAINAESADMAEQRRYLLDRYYALPEGPEGDRQAQIIKEELAQMTHSERPKQLFHWKTVAICAALGAALTLAVSVFPLTAPIFASSGLVGELLAPLTAPIVAHMTATGAALTIPTVITGIGTALGAALGATIGIDRSVVRSWFDSTEKLLYDDSHAREATLARGQQIERLHDAKMADDETKRVMDRRRDLQHQYKPAAPDQVPVPSRATAPELDQPDTKIHSAHLENRLAEIQQAMRIPAV